METLTFLIGIIVGALGLRVGQLYNENKKLKAKLKEGEKK